MRKQYDDLYDRARPVSKKHPPMSRLDRAAQFAPFAALTGYEEQLSETGRLTDRRVVLDDCELERLDVAFQELSDALSSSTEGVAVRLLYFVKDERKEGGAYREFRGRCLKIDTYERCLRFAGAVGISLEDIYELEVCHED